MSRVGGFVASSLHEDKIDYYQQKYYDSLDNKPNGRVVLLIDNELTRRGMKMIAGTEVHYTYIRCRDDLDRIKDIRFTDYNIVGHIPYEYREEIESRCVK